VPSVVGILKAYDQLVVAPGAVLATVAANHMAVLLLKPVPFQYKLLLFLMLTSTFCTPEAVSLAVPQRPAVQLAGAQPVAL
jgi:hypothetical protein